MAGAVMNKIFDFLGMETAEDEELEDKVYDYDYEEEDEQETEAEGLNKIFGRRQKVVNMPQARKHKDGYITTNNF